ncbi:hypothetical protein J6590_103499 [Homalodisca vitripennis]|nr:hypothetical protein J6590_056195 [Homalodisca vitripennis]KAG8282583.1 hypothetical protein J6590_033288 [Homalodisca vitripennis]KAG8304046.1 hypothetical protein J6590_103499 [Homalodisca vitripennis]
MRILATGEHPQCNLELDFAAFHIGWYLLSDLKLTANGTSDWRVQRLQTRILVSGKYPHRTFTLKEQWCSGCKLEFRYLVSIHIGPSHRMSNGAAAANWNLGIC